MANCYQNRIERLQRSLDLHILQTLQGGPRHGYGTSQANSGGIPQADTGSLYPALCRLERQKGIVADLRTAENRQSVGVYRLTKPGKRQWLSERSRWERISGAMAGVRNSAQRESRP